MPVCVYDAVVGGWVRAKGGVCGPSQARGLCACPTHAFPITSVCAFCDAGGWFLWQHFWFLEVSLGGMPLKNVCVLVLAAMLPAALLPGLLYSGAGPGRHCACLLS